MGQHWERPGESDDWRTPRYVFQALGCSFDTDVAGPCGTHVPADRYIDHDSLSMSWDDFGCVWCNPPFGGTNGIVAWLERFIDHADGIFLCPDATSTGWFHQALAGVRRGLAHQIPDQVPTPRRQSRQQRPDQRPRAVGHRSAGACRSDQGGAQWTGLAGHRHTSPRYIRLRGEQCGSSITRVKQRLQLL